MPPKKSKAAQSKNKAKPEPAQEKVNGTDATDLPEENIEQPAVDGGEVTKNEEQPESKQDNDQAPESDEKALAETDTKSQEQSEEKASATKPTKKRKAQTDAREPAKDARRSARGVKSAQPSQQQLLNFLLSNAALDLCRPEDETKALEEHGKDMRTYSGSAMSPFEELLCAVVLSRPISHRLGQRTIRTILNKPYEFTTPKAVKSFTPEQRHQAMFDAKTQHKEKTASQIGLIADVVTEKFGKNDEDTSLDKLREQAKKDWDSERDLLQQNIKGLGKTGLDIFFRRVQWLWPEAYPFVDERTGRGVEKLGLPKNPDQLVKLINDNWSKLDTKDLAKGDKEAIKRRAFVVICERATNADLEGKAEAIIEAAAAS